MWGCDFIDFIDYVGSAGGWGSSEGSDRGIVFNNLDRNGQTGCRCGAKRNTWMILTRARKWDELFCCRYEVSGFRARLTRLQHANKAMACQGGEASFTQ